MKRYIFLAIFAVISFAHICAYDFQVGDLYYDFNSDGVSVTVSDVVSSHSGPLTIPSSVTYQNVNYSVTSIGDQVFFYCRGLTSVTIPNSVTSIGNHAFYGCSGLTSVTIPNSVTSIGNYAFNGCSGLTSISVDANNTHYDSRNNCNAIIETATNTLLAGCMNTIIPNGVTSIGDVAFAYCTGLTSVTIPNSVTSIGYRAFNVCTGLTNVTIPNSVTSIEWSAFSGCSGLTSVTIPNSVTSIGDDAFFGCTGLTSVTIGSSVATIRNGAFSGCSNVDTLCYNAKNCNSYPFNSSMPSLRTLLIGDSVQIIPGNTFSGCSSVSTLNYNAKNCNSYPFGSSLTNLQTLVIGNSVQVLPDSAFSGCSSMKKVTIGSSVANIGTNAFSGCSNVDTLYYNAMNCNSYPFNSSMPSLRTLVIGDSVQIIQDNAFREYENLTSLSIGKSVMQIGAFAFYNCGKIDTIVIPKSVTIIGSEAFRGNASAKYIEIGSGVFNIREYAFADCIGLQSMRSKCKFPPTMSDNAFDNSPKVKPLYIPCGTMADYQRDPVWGTFYNLIEDECEYTITVVSADETMGTVSGGGEYYDGDIATLVATPLSGYQFSHWNDGNTDNPRNITVTADATFTAYFAPGTGVESITESSNEIYSCNGQIVIAGAENAIIRIFDMMGRLVCTTNATSNPQSIPVNASGVYMVQVDDKPAQRVVLIR